MRLTLIILGLLLLTAAYPLMSYEWFKPNSYFIVFDKFITGSLENISEKQLIKSGYEKRHSGNGVIAFTGADTVFLPEHKIPVDVSVQFVNGNKMPVPKLSADNILSPTRPDIYCPVLMHISYDAVNDESILKAINQRYGTKNVPAPLSVAEMPELLFVTQWQDTTGQGPVLQYTRAAYWKESTLRIPIRRNRVHAWISWYVRTIYRKLPAFMQPKWYRIITSPE
ncbi:hypothetical protein JW960_02100 [candidate division KSB1 bacterium]|nr:hypothetical protein [candidate division KSB1 bacterium]